MRFQSCFAVEFYYASLPIFSIADVDLAIKFYVDQGL